MRPARIGLLALLAAAAFLGLRFGWHHATRSESDAVARTVEHYLRMERDRGHAPKATDCSAKPDGTRGGWLIVTCLPGHLPPGQGYQIGLDDWGRMRIRSPYRDAEP